MERIIKTDRKRLERVRCPKEFEGNADTSPLVSPGG